MLLNQNFSKEEAKGSRKYLTIIFSYFKEKL